MTVSIVDRLEPVQVHEQNREWPSRTPAPVDLALEHRLEASEVGEPSEPVALRQELKLLRSPSPFRDDRHEDERGRGRDDYEGLDEEQ
jgi:hypothetical protein